MWVWTRDTGEVRLYIGKIVDCRTSKKNNRIGKKKMVQSKQLMTVK